MASFTDTTPKFNPYIQQLPVEAMVAVGTHKQKAYEEGVQKIQTQIDNIAGLDVVRDVDKAYLQSRLNQLGNNLRTVASGDFSNFQLVNSVSGMTKQLVRDEGIQNAVASTAKLRKEQAFMEEERKKGTLTPDNELHFNKKVNTWMQSSDVNQGLNAKYVPYFDVHKFAKETFDAVKPDGFSYDQIYQLDANGQPAQDKHGNLIYSPTMTRMEKEGIFPEKVKATLNQIFSDPRVSQQLGISGEYNYRNFDSKNLATVVTGQREKLEGDYADKLYNLYLNKSMGKGNQDEIDATEKGLEGVKSSYANYEKMAYDNPDAVRGLLYKDEVSNRFTTMFGQIKEKKQVMENPAWRAEFDMQKEANDRKEFSMTLAQNKLEHREEMNYKYTALAQQKELTYASIAAKEAAAGKKKPAGYGEGTGPAGQTPEQADEEAAIKASVLQETNYKTAQDNFNLATDSFLWQTIYKNSGQNNKNLQDLIDNGNTEEEAKKKMIDSAAKKAKMSPGEFRTYWNKKAVSVYNSLSPADKAKKGDIVEAYNLYHNTSKEYANELSTKQAIERRFAKQLGSVAKQISMSDIKPEKITYLDKEYTMDKADMIDLAVIKRTFLSNFASATEVKEAEAAVRRVSAKGKGALVEAITEDSRFDAKAIQQVYPWIKGILKDYGGVKSIYRAVRYGSEGLMSARNWGSVEKIEKILDSEVYAKALKTKEAIVKEAYGIKPNLKVGLVTGKGETDSQTLANVKRIGGGYGESGNLSPDYQAFMRSLGANMKDNNLQAQTVLGADNKPMVEIVSYDQSGKRIGGMIIAEDEASTLDIDVNALYEPRDIASLRSRMKFNGNQTSAGDPSDVTTYKQSDSYLGQNDFPLLDGSDYEAQANFTESGGTYFPHVYISDGKSAPKVRQLPGSKNLEQAERSVKQIDQTVAKKILMGH